MSVFHLEVVREHLSAAGEELAEARRDGLPRASELRVGAIVVLLDALKGEVTRMLMEETEGGTHEHRTTQRGSA